MLAINDGTSAEDAAKIATNHPEEVAAWTK